MFMSTTDTLLLIVLTIYTQLHLHTTQAQDTPENVCVSVDVPLFKGFNGEFELGGTFNGFPYYVKSGLCLTVYLYAAYYEPDDLNYYLFNLELTEQFPNNSRIVECGTEEYWVETPSDPSQCKGGWVLYFDNIDFAPPRLTKIAECVFEEMKFIPVPITVDAGKCKNIGGGNGGGNGDDDDDDDDSDSDESIFSGLFGRRNHDENGNNNEMKYKTKYIVINSSESLWICIGVILIGIVMVHVLCGSVFYGSKQK
eukprot:513750_1